MCASVCVPVYICKHVFVCVCVHAFGFLRRGELVFLLILLTAGARQREDDETASSMPLHRDTLLRASGGSWAGAWAGAELAAPVEEAGAASGCVSNGRNSRCVRLRAGLSLDVSGEA